MSQTFDTDRLKEADGFREAKAIGREMIDQQLDSQEFDTQQDRDRKAQRLENEMVATLYEEVIHHVDPERAAPDAADEPPEYVYRKP